MHIKLRKLNPLFFVSAAVLLAATTATTAWAADVPCGVGMAVEGDEIAGGETGEIVEIGTERPHVGWYQIKFPYNSRGEWFDPRYLDIHPSGTADRCVVQKAARPAPAPAPAPAPTQTPVPVPVPVPDVSTAPAAEPAAPDVVSMLVGAKSSNAKSTKRCQAGRRVVDRDQEAGTVAGENNGMCVVQLDNGDSKTYLQWMLSDAGKPGEKPSVPAGSYSCSAGAAGNFPIQIKNGDTYVDRGGKSGSYSVDAAGKISFSSGSLKGYRSKVLKPGKFGLSEKSSGFFATVCNLKT